MVFRSSLITISLGLLLTACAVGPDFVTPEAPKTGRFTETELHEKTVSTKGHGGEEQRFVCGKDIPANWWDLFQSKNLNTLIERGIQNSPTLEGAQAKLREAEENLMVAQSGFFPFVTGQFSPQRQRFSAQQFGAQAIPSSIFNLFNASVNVTYTLDVFGGIRRQVEASEALVENKKFEVEATYLSLTSNIVTGAITEASLREQIKATKDIIALQADELKIVEKKYFLGGASQLDVLAQKTQLTQFQAALPPLEYRLAKVRHALSVLIGKVPSEANLPEIVISDFQLPRELPVSLPSDLVLQRPDIRAAEANLHVASAAIGVATANLLPQVTLTGNYGWTPNKITDLFKSYSKIWSLMGTVLQPLFEGGELVGKRRATVAAFEATFAQYKQTVLLAFQNVADTLRALELDAEQLKIQTEAEDAARQTLKLTESRYRLGTVSYLNFLDAQRQYQQSRIAKIQAQADRFADTAALFQALGGGWWNRDQQGQEDCPKKDEEL